MRSIKQIALTVLLTVGAFSAITYTACNKDACSGVTCQNGGTCTSGTCTCPTGYEGTTCQTLSRDKFVGTYLGSEQCTTGQDNYSITLATNSGNLNLTYTNIYNQGFTAVCTITGANTFSFEGNATTQTGTVTYSGNGTLTNNQIVVAYQINNGTISNSCTFTGNK